MTPGPADAAWLRWLGLPADCGFRTIAPGVRRTDGHDRPVTWITLTATTDTLVDTAERWAADRLVVSAAHQPPATPQAQAGDLADALALAGFEVVSVRVMLAMEHLTPAEGIALAPVAACLEDGLDNAELHQLHTYVAVLCAAGAPTA